MDLLTQFAVKYRADKAPQFKKHSYTPFYFDLFNERRFEVKKILEIGVGSGASLRMWRDFFPNAQVYGADYRKDQLFTEDRIQTFLVDQRKKEHLQKLISEIGPDLDIIIEDGSHRPDIQIYTCTKIMPLLTKKDAIYIIEDVYSTDVENALATQFPVEVPKIDHIERFDNKLVVVKPKPLKNLTIFAKPAFRDKRNGPLKRVSSIIRGDQIAEYLGAKLNPTEGYQDDVTIYVKPPYKQGQDFIFEGKEIYLDIVDDLGFVDILRKHPQVNVISLSKWNDKILKKLVPNKVINIPQHHCNFERLERNSTKVKRIGIIGIPKAFDFLPPNISEKLQEKGLELVKFSDFSERQDIINFYMNIDVQIVWRPYYNYKKDLLINPLKIVNASSFGIPTVCYDEPPFMEMEGCFIPVQTLDEFLEEVDNLRNNHAFYEKISNTCLLKAENYHIEKVSELYKNLLL